MNLNQMKNVTCSECKQKVSVNFYYSGPIIHEEEDEWNGHKFFTATANAQAMCPNCGNTIRKIYHRGITSEQIIKLALGEAEVK